MPYRAVVLDLFRTVIQFTPAAPTLRVDEPGWRPAMRRLQEGIRAVLPGVDLEEFLDAAVAVSQEIAHARPPEFFEVPARQRYLNVLARLGRRSAAAESAAEALTEIQMGALVENTVLPPESRRLLLDLATHYRLALISNFDHAPTVHRALERHGIASLYAVRLVSDEFGRRKPHASIFRAALGALGVTARDAVHVGDSLDTDVAGALGVGMDAVWLDPEGTSVPPAGPQPTHVIRRLEDLRSLLLA